MRISQILKDVPIKDKNFTKDLDINHLSCNPTESQDGGMFFNLRASQDYAIKAFENGANCMVVEKPIDINVPQIIVPNARKAMSYASASFYNYNPEDFTIIGVTGTNGKTTTTHLVHQLLTKMGQKSALIGTEGVYLGDKILPAKLTTPDPIDLFSLFQKCRQSGINNIVMEVSAHASALEKIAPIKYDAMMITNITQDHLDFFKTMDAYAEQKYRLLSPKSCKRAIVNIDDSTLKQKFSTLGNHKIGIGKSRLADYQIMLEDMSMQGSSATILHGGKDYTMHTNLIGEYNVYNLVSALSICAELGYSMEDMQKVVNNTKFVVPGRMQVVPLRNGANAVIDYAHTPDGVYQFLTTLKKTNPYGKLIGVFGCGGNRDRDKRHKMGAIASELCDYVVVTSDNPRNESPELIVKDIVSGIKSTNFEQIIDRKDAIHQAINHARAGDVVAIFGKGAERTQEINGVKYPMNDFDTVNETIVR
ncbi:MAG: UDP-N-acetylmuramoyl-L-alanyl-D-glutamate--2,6-diaminopimelate ligase [Clostridia bacterium]